MFLSFTGTFINRHDFKTGIYILEILKYQNDGYCLYLFTDNMKTQL